MKAKKIFFLITMGFAGGIAINHLITLFISIMINDGNFYPVNLALIQLVGSPLKAVMIQTLLSGILGIGFALASLIWEMDNWSMVKQTAIYFGIISLVMLPIAYITNWMEHSFIGIISYVSIFFLIFVISWFVQYAIMFYKIKKINHKLK
ncbi:MAG: DUF3021 domain-containing protein [Erysipelotrichaceae bacterium]|nr:DUF3021 domain-containing protein [Erysipelotrichaceae bacterium]MDY5252858.1 DUF3021 domain-containing protein [Erysipelotrichaceae bacterium]